MTQDELKRLAAQAAVAHVPADAIVGIGTGSTVNHFIDALAASGTRVAGTVASSRASAERLAARGLRVLDANAVESIPIYVDGCDEIDTRGFMIKGGGAALTREKIVADLAERFVCIADDSKHVEVLGRFPLPVEVIGIAASQVMRRLRALGGEPALRAGVTTDNGHPIIDVRGLAITDPLGLEAEINQWPGVVSVGIFGRLKAHLCLLATAGGVRTLLF